VKAGVWILLLCAAGFGISAVFAGELRFSRDLVVVAYLLVGGGVLLAFLSHHREVFRHALQRHRRVGILVGLGIGALLAFTVLQQPRSPGPSGLKLAWSLVWLGLVYGLLDGLLLSVAPVMVWDHTPGTPRRLRHVALGFAASMLVTALYHAGYPEFRGPQLSRPLVGNAVLTAGYLLTGSVATPLLGHVIMHGAAVLHGLETTLQLPPHYPEKPHRLIM
jgi:hypothetical protein